MPTRLFAATADAGADAIGATVLVPVFLSAEADAGAEPFALGLGPRALFGGAADGVADTSGKLTVLWTFAGSADAVSDTRWPGVGVRRALSATADAGAEAAIASFFRADRLFAGFADAGADTALPHLRIAPAYAGGAGAGADTAAEWNYPIPEVRDPLPGEAPGTVNLVRNPSLEHAAFGLTDWSADAGVTLAIDAAAEAWHGTQSAKATVAAGGAAKRIRIASKAGLGTVGGSWVANAWLAGDPADLPVDAGETVGVAVRLRAEYRDGTADEGDPLAYVPQASPPDWAACPTEPLAADPAKTVDRLVLVAEVPVLAAAADFWLDGAQIEADRGQRGTPFASGDMGAGHRWAGIEGLSPSIREPMLIGGGS